MRKIKLENLDALLAAIAGKEKLYMPQDTNGGAYFLPWKEGAVLSGALNTSRSAKEFFFPQTENLMDFKIEGKKIEIIDTRTETEDFVVFGVRACDARAMTVLDRVFLTEPVDTYYKNRREHGTIVSVACTRPNETCFCSTFDIDAANPEGDIVCWKTEDEMFFEAKTEKGTALLASLEGMTEECPADSADATKEMIRGRMEKLPMANLTAEKFGAGKTMELFDDPAWKTLSEACLGCGTCTFVCPTCQCYDIKDFKTNCGVCRFRVWDSCMYSEFTKMSAGQPRLTQVERFRQRFMHKLVYFPTNNDGLMGCVGCGRCLAKCPVSMNIVKVMKNIGKGGKNDG